MNKKEEIFTIGDKTNNGTISKFEIDTYGVRVFFEEKPKNYHVSLNSIKHAKKSLFTTEDGVDIFKSDNCYWVNKKSYYQGFISNIEFSEPTKYYYFSTKEAAEEYILMNKLCLSINEVVKLNFLIEKDLVEFVKNKI